MQAGNVMTLINKTLLRGVGLAATGGLLFAGPAMAGLRPAAERSEPVADPVQAATSASLPDNAEPGPLSVPPAELPVQDLQLAEAVPTESEAPQVAQTYPLPVVKEGYSANRVVSHHRCRRPDPQ